MAAAQAGKLLRHIEELAGQGDTAGRTDRQLLEDFAACRDEAAFAALVARHGLMVLGVCRRVLRHEQDAEDAFQAAFLALARGVASIRSRGAPANWLHGVAYRIAMKVRRSAARRRRHEARLRDRVPLATPGPAWDDVQAVLDEEIQRLPEAYRSAFVLCVLEGKSTPEAAALLGWKVGTVSSRLTRARERLRQRLTRRGIELTALLATLSVAEGAGQAGVPGVLAHAATRLGPLGTVGASAVREIPPHIAELAAGVTKAMFLRKARVATVVLLAAGLFAAGAAVLTHQVLASQVPKEPPAAAPAPAPKEAAKQPASDEKGTIAFSGRVVGPDGKPVAGAKLYLLYQTPKAVPVPVRASSDAVGNYRFSVAKADFDRSFSSAPWRVVSVVAMAPGYGLGVGGGLSSPSAPSALRLEKDDAPLHGRVLDLEGKPLAGVSVHVLGLYAPLVTRGGESKDDLVNFVVEMNDGRGARPPGRDRRVLMLAGNPLGHHVGAIIPPAKTGADGRFTIKGIGNERIVELRIEGPTVVAQKVFAMTWPGKTVRSEGQRQRSRPARVVTIYGNGFEHIAAPCRPVVGVVRDKDTGQPIPGAIVTNYAVASFPSGGIDLRAVADKEGRFRLLGLAKGKDSILWAWPPEGEPYLSAEQKVPDTPGLDAVAVDFRLKRGVWITGRVLDKVTRQPGRAQIGYGVFEDNPHRDDVRRAHYSVESRADDGTFRLVGVPGRGLLAAQAQRDLAGGALPRYSQGVGADRIKGLDRSGYFPTYPRPLLVRQYNTFAEVSPPADAKEVTCDILLDPGHQLTVKVLGPDDKPLTGVRARGEGPMVRPGRPQTGEFTVSGAGPGGPRLLQFDHPEKNLAGWLVVTGDEKGPLTVKLVPAGVLTGRLVTPDGEPVTQGEIIAPLGGSKAPANRDKPDRGTLPDRVRPDKDGKFRITGLAPGLKYRFTLVIRNYGHPVGGDGDLTFKPGETKDLGDVVVKPAD
jgi:RNA polymerase sigma factor (sigma-70 family)